MIHNRKSALALTQIFLLVISIVSMGYIIGGQIGFVSAVECENVRGDPFSYPSLDECPGDLFFVSDTIQDVRNHHLNRGYCL